MPRSIKRRLERLEARAPKPDRGNTRDQFYDWLEPELPDPVRARLWAAWGHPDLDRAGGRVVCVFADWARANGLLPNPGGRLG